MEVEATMSSANQFTVPKQLRQALGLVAGDKIVFRFNGPEIIVKKAESKEEKIKRLSRELDELKSKREARMTLEQREFAEKTAGWTASQYREYIDNLPETRAYFEEKYGV